MANSTSVKVSMQNAWAASTVVNSVTHKFGQFSLTTEAEQSLVAQFTGTGSNNVTVGASGAITVNGTTQKSPISGANLDWDSHLGFGIMVERAATATAPTGTPTLDLTNWMGMTIEDVPIPEGTLYMVTRATGVTAVNADAITVILTGTTGYKVSVIAFGLTT